MSQMDNNNMNEMLNSLGETANQIGLFFTNVKENLSEEQKAELDKQLGGAGGFNSQMNRVSNDLSNALKDLNNFKA